MQRSELHIQFGSVGGFGGFSGQGLVAFAQLHQLLLQTGEIHAFKALLLQGGQFLMKFGERLFQIGQPHGAASPLPAGLVLLALQINKALLQLPDLLPALFQIGFRGKNVLRLQVGPRVLIQLG